MSEVKVMALKSNNSASLITLDDVDNICMERNADGTFYISFNYPVEFNGNIIQSDIVMHRAEITLDIKVLPDGNNNLYEMKIKEKY